MGSPGKWVFRIDGLGIQSAGCKPNAVFDPYGDHSLRVCDKVEEKKEVPEAKSEKKLQEMGKLLKKSAKSGLKVLPGSKLKTFLRKGKREKDRQENGATPVVQYGDQIMPEKETKSRGKNR